MNLDLAGRTALVTGASKGIGLGIATAFAREGCNLVLVSRSADEASLRRAIGDMAGSLRVIRADLSTSGTAERLAAKAPNIDILVNNAGAVPAGNLLDVDEERWRAAWDLKVFGYINMCRAFYPLLKARGGGTIVNIAGASATMKNPGAICIAAGNAAIVVLSQALGSDSAKDGIRVLAISPGPVATERLAATTGAGGVAISLPFGRAAAIDEIASTVAFLASPRSGYTTGSVVTIDGGLSSGSQPL